MTFLAEFYQNHHWWFIGLYFVPLAVCLVFFAGMAFFGIRLDLTNRTSDRYRPEVTYRDLVQGTFVTIFPGINIWFAGAILFIPLWEWLSTAWSNFLTKPIVSPISKGRRP